MNTANRRTLYITTEALRRDDVPDWEVGLIQLIKPRRSGHLVFVDVQVETEAGDLVTLRRVDTDKLRTLIREAEKRA